MDGQYLPKGRVRRRETRIIVPVNVELYGKVTCVWDPFHRDSWGLHAPKPASDLSPGLYLCRFFGWGVVGWMCLRSQSAWVGKPLPDWKFERAQGRWDIVRRDAVPRWYALP